MKHLSLLAVASLTLGAAEVEAGDLTGKMTGLNGGTDMLSGARSC